MSAPATTPLPLVEVAPATAQKNVGDQPTRHFVEGPPGIPPFRIVLLAGFETFNRALYQRAADYAAKQSPGLEIQVFTERDIKQHPALLEAALSEADVFFASLIFDYDEVLWLTPRIARVPYRFIFESALELMSSTQVRFGALLWHDPGPILSRAGRYPVFLQWYTALIPRGFVEAGRNLLHGRRRRRPEAGHAARRQGAPVQVQQHARGGPPRRLHQVRPESARRWSDSTKLGGCAQFEVDLSVLRPESCRN